MKIIEGTKIKVTGQAGVPDQYPRFWLGFGNKIGTVTREFGDFLKIKLKDDRYWLEFYCRRDWVTQQ